jgi:hypothetical protein
VTGLRKSFGDKVLDGVDLLVPDGTIFLCSARSVRRRP